MRYAPHLTLVLQAQLAFAAKTRQSVMKRLREVEDDFEHPAKVRRIANIDRLSKLSDELLIRILSFLPVSSLLTSQM